MAAIRKADLAHVYWIGGSPCSGKSSIAAALAEKHGWQVFSCDEAFYRHYQVINPVDQPTFARVMALPQEQLWMRPVEQQVSEEIEIYREEFPFLLADLHSLATGCPVIAEGAALLAEFVQPYLFDSRRFIAIVPSAEFQLEHYSKREWVGEHLYACSDPQQAFRNWMERDIQFGQHALASAQARCLKTLVVDGKKTLEENYSEVEAYFLPSENRLKD